jgi:hypothetical protein
LAPVTDQVVCRLFQHLTLDVCAFVLAEIIEANEQGHRYEGGENQNECSEHPYVHDLLFKLCGSRDTD